VNFITYTNFLQVEDIIEEYELEITQDQLVKIHQFAYDNADKPYGVLDIFGLGYVVIARKFGLNPPNPVHDNGTEYVCSELISYILVNFLNVKLSENINLMMPKDVNTLVKQIGKKI
jgi:hypothetical protein